VVLPVISFEAHAGWPMVRHRLVDSQPGAGASLRNLAAVIGGQLAYVSPLLAIAGVLVAIDLVRDRARDVIARLLFFAFVIPLGPLLALGLWSRVAEPHWLAPAWVALALQYARGPSAPKPETARRSRLHVAAVACAGALSLGAYAWVLIPASARLAPASADMRFDLASELYGWPRVSSVVRSILAAKFEADPEGDDTVVVGPHWIVCAQLAASLGPTARVGCDTPIKDDFDDWLPRPAWHRSSTLVFVTDTRFPVDLDARFPAYATVTSWEVPIDRGGRRARTFTITLLEKLGGA
jgi:hypothetical protein